MRLRFKNTSIKDIEEVLGRIVAENKVAEGAFLPQACGTMSARLASE